MWVISIFFCIFAPDFEIDDWTIDEVRLIDDLVNCTI